LAAKQANRIGDEIMAFFQYQGFEDDGRAARGVVEAASEQLALDQLAESGIVPTDLSPGSAPDAGDADATASPLAAASGGATLGELWTRLRGERVAASRLVEFVGELATLVKADVPLLEALRVLGRQEPHPALRGILGDLARRVAGGEAFSHALAAHPRAFPSLLVTMARVGETGGKLGDVLARMGEWMEREEDARSDVRGAMIYPAVIVTLAIVSVVVLSIFVLPKFRLIFAGHEAQLPLPTKMLMGFSTWARAWWWTVPIGVVAASWGWRRALKTTTGRRAWDRLILRVPVFGPLVLQAELARLATACASLLASGVPLLETLRVSRGLVGNSQMEELVARVTDDVTRGQELARSLSDSPWFPPTVTHLLSVGERTGRLGEMFDRVAARFEKQTRRRVRIMIELLSPLLIVALAIGVGTIAASILLPIYQMNQLTH
jgi:type II secretory pathway component PulF